MSESCTAFISKKRTNKIADGLLSGLSFAVKDVFDVKDHVATAGNPDWQLTHEPAAGHAEVIKQLLKAGAELVGQTHTDELMYSLNGENYHYGTPLNPKAPDRIPGGSSSGSASAVADGLVDFALGTDTGGSVRIPSSYCGIYGFRPTHGAVSVKGLIPLAKSFDTVGWMANDPKMLLDVGLTLLNESIKTPEFSRILVAEDVLPLLGKECKQLFLQLMELVENQIRVVEKITLAPDGLEDWMNTFRTLQGYEIWEDHGEWIEQVKPAFGPGIKERFEWTKTIAVEEREVALVKREDVKSKVRDLLGDHSLLMMLTTPDIAPMKNSIGGELDQHRKNALKMTCIAGLAGVPQITIPLGEKDGIPLGLSFIAGANQDISLLEWVNQKRPYMKKVTNAEHV
ncbi:hypothetical protein JCM9140_4283 [Halalkalibacter wakoensis JCM 9140]|uniref:Amidase domain-containing protein n=1 Tax=Halalkalibacter wakoensis JCM 9140 TaxID=1236970 RepID=W4Q9M4_9BACI|nr:amidase [Halalkalibacter wakoensis]GAE28089.1 hypothetical protein JCM9140_4283 [Halalkalibacter wakoensis JCM 9140]